MQYINFQLTDFPNKGIETVCETNTRKKTHYDQRNKKNKFSFKKAKTTNCEY